MTTIMTRIAGFNHRDGATAVLAKLCHGDELRLEPEPGNKHDPNAIRIMYGKGKKAAHVGYVPAVDAKLVGRWLKAKGTTVTCQKTRDTFNSCRIRWRDVEPEGDPLA